MWVLTLGTLFSVMSVGGCAAAREVLDRMMDRNPQHDGIIDLDPYRDQVDEWIDVAEVAANKLRKEANAPR